MNRSGNLFLKMFIGFWLATVAIAASWMLTNQYFEEQPGDVGRPLAGKQVPPHRFMLRQIYLLQNAEDAQLRQLLQNPEGPGKVQIYLLDLDGQDYLGRNVPDIVQATANQLERRRRGVRRDEGIRYVAHEIFRNDRGHLRAVFVFHPPPSTILRLLGASPALRLAMAVAISGLVCFFLSRLLTSRITQLRTASRELAEGNLDSRAPVRTRGGDETDDLARDFNSMADQLQERIENQKRLLSDVSHELRSPLARLHVALALAQDDPGRSLEHLQRIEQEAQRLEQLIGQLLSSQAEAPVLDQHLDLVALLEVVTADARFEGQHRGQTVELHCEISEAVVSSTGDLLRSGFENVLRNALAHSPDGAKIQVWLEETGGSYQIRFEDEGPGVPEADLERIFHAFYRVDTARTRESGGYGLGLAIARRAILAHGGQVSATNTNRGLCVTVTLPSSDDLAVADQDFDARIASPKT